MMFHQLTPTKMLSREEETKRRTIAWEEKNGKKLEDLSREEWIVAVARIMAMTEREAEAYLDHLLIQRQLKKGMPAITETNGG